MGRLIVNMTFITQSIVLGVCISVAFGWKWHTFHIFLIFHRLNNFCKDTQQMIHSCGPNFHIWEAGPKEYLAFFLTNGTQLINFKTWVIISPLINKCMIWQNHFSIMFYCICSSHEGTCTNKLYICISVAERGQSGAHTAGWNVIQYYGCTMNHKNHITGIVMHICPWSGPSISSINHNHFYTCKVRIINIRVTTMINHLYAPAASEHFLMTHKDVNNYAVCTVHHCNAPWLVVDSLFILSALLFHCMWCKMGSLALNMRMWKMEILGKMMVDIVGRKPQTILTISR